MQVSWAQLILSRLTCAERTGVSVLVTRRHLTDSASSDRGVILSAGRRVENI